ncbi:MAG: signal peptidase I [Pseudomonadales bacterium]
MEYLNFPLILVLLVFGSGLIWLVDTLTMRRNRLTAIEQLQLDWPEWDKDGSADQQHFLNAAREQAGEPILVEYSRSLFPVLAIVLVLRSFIVEPFQIPSGSMIPTLEVGDFILVNKFTYGIRLPVVRTKVLEINAPERGEVMVFFPPHTKQYFIKRVIGLPGDLVEYKDKILTINGVVQPQTLLADLPPDRPSERLATETLNGIEHEVRQDLRRYMLDDFSVKVRSDHYFLMGDNRDNSSDSRVWGQVPEANIVGRAFAIWMHWEEFLSLPSFSRVGTVQ